MPKLHLAHFRIDVTPPLEHPLCGGWIEPVRGIDDPLQAVGIVLMGVEKPIVYCAVDWCGLRNEAYRIWRAALAKAAHTTPERVMLHCIHAHDAPFADIEAQKMLAAIQGPPLMNLKFFDSVVSRSAKALEESLMKAVEFDRIGVGSAEVKEVASNRRVIGDDGKVKYTRTSATKSKEARDAPVGLIDPLLRTLSFWHGAKPLAALHFYATHPMSYYGQGRVSPDFCGLAREKRQAEQKDVVQMYFTGCAGNVTAGKYNDGAKENRAILRDRMHTGMVAAWEKTKTEAVTGWNFRSEPLLFPPRTEPTFLEKQSELDMQNEKLSKAKRNNAALQLAWLKRREVPIELTCVDFGTAATLHLPGEPFIEYQLAANKLREKGLFVAGYGDGGIGYLPTAEAYLQAGYEPTVALVGPNSEAIMLDAIKKILK